MSTRSSSVIAAFVVCLCVVTASRGDDKADFNAARNRAREFEKKAQHGNAEIEWRKALDVALRLNGEDHKDTASIMYSLATC